VRPIDRGLAVPPENTVDGMTSAQATALHYGLLGFLVVWGVLVVPQVLVQLERFGAVVPVRLLRTAAVTLYGCLAVAVVMLPLPVPGEPRLSQTVQIVPLQWVADVGTELARHDRDGLLAAFTSQTFQQLAMNVLLFVPLGAMALRWWRRRFAATVLLGFAVSLLVEITQLSANFGTAPYQYRIFDVDDLMANTAGAAVGAVAAVLFRMLRTGSVPVHTSAPSRFDSPASPARSSSPAGVAVSATDVRERVRVAVEVPTDRPRPSLPVGPVYAVRRAGRLAGPPVRR
jgi:VanZ family protein